MSTPGRLDWKARAQREAAAIIAEAAPNTSFENYPALVALVAIGWLQGSIFGSHEHLERLDDTFDELRAAL